MLLGWGASEREQVVHEEIPHGDYTYGEELDHIEVPLEASVKQVYDRCVYGQTNDRDADETQVLLGYVRVGAGKRPRAVEDVVRRGGTDEPQGVSRILVELEQLLAYKRDAEVDEDSRTSDDTEFQELLEEDPVGEEAYLVCQRYHTSFNWSVCYCGFWSFRALNCVRRLLPLNQVYMSRPRTAKPTA